MTSTMLLLSFLDIKQHLKNIHTLLNQKNQGDTLIKQHQNKNNLSKKIKVIKNNWKICTIINDVNGVLAMLTQKINCAILTKYS